MSNTESISSLPFEEALSRLESIVETLENGEIPLSELVEKYELGTRLLDVCRNRLGEADLRIEKVSRVPSGIETTPVDVTSPGQNT